MNNINSIQLNWCRGLVVEHNIIDGVLTSDPDGSGIIVDWAWTDSLLVSDEELTILSNEPNKYNNKYATVSYAYVP
jgi:hypothetical protein